MFREMTLHEQMVLEDFRKGRTCLRLLAEAFGLKHSTLNSRVYISKWPLEQALLSPIGSTGTGPRYYVEFADGTKLTLYHCARRFGLKYRTLLNRYNRNPNITAEELCGVDSPKSAGESEWGELDNRVRTENLAKIKVGSWEKRCGKKDMYQNRSENLCGNVSDVSASLPLECF